MNDKIANLNNWGPLNNLSEEKQRIIIEKIKFITLEMGHKISDFEDLPAGIILLQKGNVREIFKDKNNDLHTISIYKENEIVAGTTIFQTKNVVHVQYTASNSKKNILGSLDFLFFKLII